MPIDKHFVNCIMTTIKPFGSRYKFWFLRIESEGVCGAYLQKPFRGKSSNQQRCMFKKCLHHPLTQNFEETNSTKNQRLPKQTRQIQVSFCSVGCHRPSITNLKKGRIVPIHI